MTRLNSRKCRRMSRRAMHRLKKASYALTDLWVFLNHSRYQSDVDVAKDLLLHASTGDAQERLRILNDMAEASRKEAQR